MNSSIHVYIYSYKGKLLKDVVSNLIEKSSKNNEIFIQVDDQNPLYRKDIFDNFANTSYNHIFWDHIKSPCKYKVQGIHDSGCDYTLILSDNIFLQDNWDEKLIDSLDDNSVISGHGKTALSIKNLFYINKTSIETKDFSISQFVSRDLIFAKSDILKKYIHPEYIKYNGEEEYLSLLYFCNGLNIISCPSDFYEKRLPDTIESLYVPFSIDHNYNLIIDLLKDGKNKFTNFWGLTRSIKDLEEYHGINFNNLEYLPFENNDVEYDNVNVAFDNIDQRKFMTRTHSIR